MRRFLFRSLFLLVLWLACGAPGALAQSWGTVEGRVAEAPAAEPLPGVTVVVAGTNFGTATDDQGFYRLRLPAGRYALRFSAIGFAPRVDSVVVVRDATTRMDVRLRPATIELGGIEVEDQGARPEAGVHTLDPQAVQDIPSPFKGLQALKALPGVATNNELSNQYSVRGGGFNENLIFINGFEVYLPFRPRQGEQEGLGLLNPDLASRITLYTGGFPARYGGKLSSALEVDYGHPEAAGGTAAVSLLDANVATGATLLDGRLGWSFGLRKARAQHFFSTQELKGDYRPDYTDLQGLVSYRLAPGHEVEAIGMWVDHTFELDPRNRRTYFGTVSSDPSQPSNLQSLWTEFSGGEVDGYATRFAGLRLTNRLSPRLRMTHDASFFATAEDERYDIQGAAVLYQVNPGSGNPGTGAGHIPLGAVRQEDGADNRVEVETWTAQGRYHLFGGRHAAEAGWYGRLLRFDDRLQEKGVVVGRNSEGDLVRVVIDSLTDRATLDAHQAGLYAQDAIDLLPTPNRLIVTAGLRADYFSFNGEWTASPRVSARYLANDRLTLNASWGVYYQAPAYRELRGKPVPGQTILGALNRDLKAQRSIQYVAGAEYFMPMRRLYVRAEAFYKDLDRLVSYDVENVRVLYSGENDSRGFAYGLDLQLRGEFVPGLESWINYSFLDTRERFLEGFVTQYNQGLIPRPADQRHTLSIFIQDYIPRDPSWKLHLRALFGSGLPYTPPVPGPRLGSLVIQLPGPRHSARYPNYMRLDLGATKHIALTEGVGLELTGELLNVFDMVNTVAYSWVPASDGIWRRIPTRLTPRTFNLRARVRF